MALVGLAALLAGPTAGRGMTLEDALVKVYLESPRLAGARARLRAVDESVPAALAGWRPRLAANAGTAYAEDGRRTGMGLHQGVQLTQPVYSGGATAADMRRAEQAVRAERARLSGTEQDVLLEAVEAYTAVLREQAVLDLARRNEHHVEEQLAATRDRYRFGELTRTDVAQAETRLARARADRAQAEGDLAVAGARFVRIVGVPAEGLAPGEPLDDAAAAEEPEPPEVRAARFALGSAQEDVALSRAQLRPRVTLDGEVGYDSGPASSGSRDQTLRIGASISIPLYQGGGEYAAVRRARQTVSERRQALNEAQRAAAEALAAARADLAAIRARIAALGVEADRAAFALEGVRQEALVGARTVLDVLDAEGEQFAAEVALARARRDEIVASYRLRAATGRLDAVSLGLPVEPYDAEAHYRVVRDKWTGLGEDDPE
jgi:TolC family type I secretion outer membrane protein